MSGDRVVAFVEVVSPGNKATRHALRSFVEKAAELLEKRIHLLILDVQPPGRRDANGIHGATWEEVTGDEYIAPSGKPLTLAAYESALTVRAYVEPVAVGDTLIDMPLFLEPGAHVLVPLEVTYQAAWRAVPRRWQEFWSRNRHEPEKDEGDLSHAANETEGGVSSEPVFASTQIELRPLFHLLSSFYPLFSFATAIASRSSSIATSGKAASISSAKARRSMVRRKERALAKRAPRADLAPDPGLPADTRLWAALQRVGGGTWGGCV